MTRLEIDFQNGTSRLKCDKCEEEYNSNVIDALLSKHLCFRCKYQESEEYVQLCADRKRERGKKRDEFLGEQYSKLRKFRMKSSSANHGTHRLDNPPSLSIDQYIKQKLGDWNKDQPPWIRKDS